MRQRSVTLFVLASLIFSSVFAGRVFASPTITVTPWSTSYQADSNHLSFKVYFNVTNTGSSLDYIILQRTGMDIQLPQGTPCQGVGSQTPNGCLALGVPSPEFGASLLPGQTKTMRANVDIGSPTTGTFRVTFPFHSELTGVTVTANVTLVLVQPDQSSQATLSGTVTSSSGSPIAGATLQVVDLTRNVSPPAPTVDPGGRFSQMVYPDPYFIRVDAPGFEGISKELNVSARQNLNLQFVLSPATYTVGTVTSSIVNLSDSSWTLTGSSDLSQLASAPMNHGGTANQNSNGTLFGVSGGKITWKVPFSPQFGPHVDSNQYQAADGYIGVSADGLYAAAIDWNGVLDVVNITSGRVLASTDRAQDSDTAYPPNSEYRSGFFSVGFTAFSPDDKLLAAGGANGLLELFSLPSMQLVWSKSLSAEVRGLKFTPDSGRLAVGDGDWHVYMLNASSGATLWTGNDQFWPFFFMAMNQGGTLVGEGGKDGTFSLWNAQTGVPLWSKEVFPGFVTSGAISTDGTKVMFSHWSRGIFLFDGTGNYLWSKQVGNNPVADMTPDGSFVFAATAVPQMVQPGQPGAGSLYLLDGQGTTLWSYTPDPSAYCQNPAPFPQGQFKSALIYESPDKTSVTVAASCIGGTVFEFHIPILASSVTTTTSSTSTSTVTSSSSSTIRSTSSTNTSSTTAQSIMSITSTSTMTAVTTSTVPEFVSPLGVLIVVLTLLAVVVRSKPFAVDARR